MKIYLKLQKIYFLSGLADVPDAPLPLEWSPMRTDYKVEVTKDSPDYSRTVELFRALLAVVVHTSGKATDKSMTCDILL